MLLYISWDGEFLIAEQVLSAMTHDRDADTPHFTISRLFGLYTDVFCDRVALEVVGSPLDVISMLVKVLFPNLSKANDQNTSRSQQKNVADENL